MKKTYGDLLTAGIALGVIAAVLVIGVGQTVIKQREILRDVRRKSATYFRIQYPHEADGARGLIGIPLKTVRDLKAFLAPITEVSILTKDLFSNAGAKYRGEILDAQIVMADSESLGFGMVDMVKGRFISSRDFDACEKVCVVSSGILSYLGIEEITGDETLQIGDSFYAIIGSHTASCLWEGSGTASAGVDGIEFDKAVFVPATTAYRYVHGLDENSALICTLAVKAADEGAARKIEDALLSTKGQEEDFSHLRVTSGLRQLEQNYGEQLKTFAALLAASCLILLVAGLNTIQITVANVFDAKRSIGLKVALGATPLDIMKEIAGEILTCSLKGGYIAVAVSGIVHTGINRHLNYYWASFNIYTVMVGFALSLVTGLVTSLIPARFAARLDPAQALREE